MPKNVYRPFSVTVCRDCTEKAIASAEGEPPCILAERAMRARSRTQVRFPYLGQVGNPCPAAMSWKDLRHLLQDKRAVYDTDAYGTTVLDSIRRNIPKHQFGGSDPDSEWAASQAYIAPHGKNWKTTLGDPHVPIAVYPGDAWWENWRRNIYYKQVTLDPFTTWLAFTASTDHHGLQLRVGQDSTKPCRLPPSLTEALPCPLPCSARSRCARSNCPTA